MRIAHLSDPHVIDWSETRWRQFVGKRLTGGLNFVLNRRKVHRLEVLEAILEDVARNAPDHIAVTGDISSLAFPYELRRFGDLLDRLGLEPTMVSVIPGNHDAYTRHAWVKRRTLAELGRFATCDLSGGMPRFPFVRLRGPIAIIGLDSAVARPWFVASGAVGHEQLDTLESLLEARDVRERFPVVLVHHPPISYPSWFKELHAGLMDREHLLEVLRRGLAGSDGLVLSGHWHDRHRTQLDLPGHVELLVAPSASHFGGPPSRLAAYHLIDLEETEEGGIKLDSVRARGYDPEAGEVIDLEEMAPARPPR